MGKFLYVGLFQIPQRYRFSSKSQQSLFRTLCVLRCFRYHKGTDFQANHNMTYRVLELYYVVLDTTKVQIFKQITTYYFKAYSTPKLFQIPQRYRFSSKSQHISPLRMLRLCCFRYHKGTDFQANHNYNAKIQIKFELFQIPQRYRFSSKSQLSNPY